jgi:hypothetical protein
MLQRQNAGKRPPPEEGGELDGVIPGIGRIGEGDIERARLQLLDEAKRIAPVQDRPICDAERGDVRQNRGA